MMEWVLDTSYRPLFDTAAGLEKSVIVFGSMEATLTPLMEAVERDHPPVKVFSLPSVDHPQYGHHIELGVKGEASAVASGYAALLQGLRALGVRLGPELVR
jgi:molybdopterin-biosynthesis enzyme MoeA-like protein